ncbi:MAG: TIGR00730 family Rossman fold protein, partial [Thermoleophilia bacterium]|nr:TIGR00730 family Rossman fold protein [Thermoleophilia bacterium]
IDWMRSTTLDEGFIQPEDLDRIRIADTPEEAVAFACGDDA